MRPVDVMELASEFPYKKELPKGDPGRFVYLQQLTFGAVKLAVATSEDPYFQPESWDYPNLPLAREAVTGKSRIRVFDAIAAAGWVGMTDEEIQDALAMNPNTERPRRGELVKDEHVLDSKRTRPCRSGLAGIVWVARSFA